MPCRQAVDVKGVEPGMAVRSVTEESWSLALDGKPAGTVGGGVDTGSAVLMAEAIAVERSPIGDSPVKIARRVEGLTSRLA
jgi:hypothetical protein